jgi:hypothetical protein
MHPHYFSGTGHARQVRMLNFTRGRVLLACIADYNCSLLLIAAQSGEFCASAWNHPASIDQASGIDRLSGIRHKQVSSIRHRQISRKQRKELCQSAAT